MLDVDLNDFSGTEKLSTLMLVFASVTRVGALVATQ